MNLKTMKLEIKQLTEEGTFEGLLSPYGNKDDGDDIVEKGAYTKTLKEQGKNRPLLWQHKSDTPIGSIELEDRPNGLWAKGKLLRELPKAQEAYVLLKAGVIKAMSIGFQSIKDEIKDGVRHLKEIKLYEGSLVTFPMNEQALITNVKDLSNPVMGGTNDFNDALSQVQLYDLRWQLDYALTNALNSMHSAKLSKPETMSGLSTILDQHKDAYMRFAPDYYDAVNNYGGMEVYARRMMEIKSGGKTKTVDGEDLTAGDFLIVGDAQDTSTWKLPWKFSTDDKTKAHLRNALARFDQLLGVSDADKAKAKKRLISLCEKYGIDVSDDFKKSGPSREMKKGAKFSAETMGIMTEACKGIQGHLDNLVALVGVEPDDDSEDQDPASSTAKAAKTESEPAEDHSAAQALIDKIKAQLSS
jgi:HK97 family phage prohead protease